jgi:hypothetical protein
LHNEASHEWIADKIRLRGQVRDGDGDGDGDAVGTGGRYEVRVFITSLLGNLEATATSGW